MSALVNWTGPAGRVFVSTTDLTLADLSRFTRRHPVSAHGKSAVLTSDGHVVALLDDARFRTDESIRTNVFKPVAQIVDDTVAGFWRELERLSAMLERRRAATPA